MYCCLLDRVLLFCSEKRMVFSIKGWMKERYFWNRKFSWCSGSKDKEWFWLLKMLYLALSSGHWLLYTTCSLILFSRLFNIYLHFFRLGCLFLIFFLCLLCFFYHPFITQSVYISWIPVYFIIVIFYYLPVLFRKCFRIFQNLTRSNRLGLSLSFIISIFFQNLLLYFVVIS